MLHREVGGLSVQLVPWMVAGVQTQFLHLERELELVGAEIQVHPVQPFVSGGRIEKLPLPAKTRGTIRSVLGLKQAFRTRADAVWSQVALPLLPYVLAVPWLRRAPVFYAIDCTPTLLFRMDRHYGVASDPDSIKGRLTTALLKSFFIRCAGLLPWSQWAARSMIEDYEADPARVQVLPPGVDIAGWRPPQSTGIRHDHLQLLFVGADFERKGGPMLLDIFRRHLRDTCDLHLVTRVAASPEPGVTIHTGYAPGAPELMNLFQSADLLVVPTLADCFSMAAIEAMACGLPVITSPVGGIPEIVEHGVTGLLPPTGDGRRLLESIRTLRDDDGLRRRLGAAGRDVAVRRFNATTQARRMVELILSEIESRSSAPEPSPVTRA
jgi:glycosyltransferase involved in cell wall biosynthesis